jgi:hypothetical protein
MKWLTISIDQKAELDSINAAHPTQKCEPVETADGTLVTSSDKLTDAYWADWRNWLLSLTPFEGEPIWPTPPNGITETNEDE